MRAKGDHRTADLFDTPPAATGPGALAGAKTQIAHAISAVIRDGGVDRFEIAARMSRLLGEDVSKTMLDAYSAESRDDQNIPAYRLLAFILATESFPVLDQLLAPLGCRLLIGKQTQLAALTKAEMQRAALDRQIKHMRNRLKDSAHG